MGVAETIEVTTGEEREEEIEAITADIQISQVEAVLLSLCYF